MNLLQQHTGSDGKERADLAAMCVYAQTLSEPFFTTREKGTGLGLPLARKLLEAHRGSLSVESRPGRTVFRAELPLAG